MCRAAAVAAVTAAPTGMATGIAETEPAPLTPRSTAPVRRGAPRLMTIKYAFLARPHGTSALARGTGDRARRQMHRQAPSSRFHLLARTMAARFWPRHVQK